MMYSIMGRSLWDMWYKAWLRRPNVFFLTRQEKISENTTAKSFANLLNYNNVEPVHYW